MQTAHHVPVFESTAQKTHEWLDELVDLGQFEDHAQAYSALRAVLHALRDRLTVDEAAHLGAQLPMLVRGFYYEGWKPSLAPNRERHREAFLDHVRESLRGNSRIEPEKATMAAFGLLKSRVTRGEINDIQSMLPEEIREVWP